MFCHYLQHFEILFLKNPEVERSHILYSCRNFFFFNFKLKKISLVFVWVFEFLSPNSVRVQNKIYKIKYFKNPPRPYRSLMSINNANYEKDG